MLLKTETLRRAEKVHLLYRPCEICIIYKFLAFLGQEAMI